MHSLLKILSERSLSTTKYSLKGLAASVFSLALLGAEALAQPAPAAYTGEIPKAAPAPVPQKVRAFTGNWGRTGNAYGLAQPGMIPFNAEYQKQFDAQMIAMRTGQPIESNLKHCIPEGMPMMMLQGMDISANANRITVISSDNSLVRFIWLDGRQHTSDDVLIDTPAGESIAHWQGDTLVVDTTGLSSANEIEYGLPVNKMHIVERWRMTSATQMEIENTIEDPVALTKPWVRTLHYERRPLATNAPNCVAATDRTLDKGNGFDLTPPKGGYVPPNAKK